ncbi:MAG: hypothetical protein JNK45_19590 [Myxococcales bacterium]|nr:hypothetical protein [Myxococcales bacterium]
MEDPGLILMAAAARVAFGLWLGRAVYRVGKSRDPYPAKWGFVGFMFPVIGLLILVFVGRRPGPPPGTRRSITDEPPS